jgi:hypothetical protein
MKTSMRPLLKARRQGEAAVLDLFHDVADQMTELARQLAK